MGHRLIIVSGVCPGAGKSTFAAALSTELTRRGIANRLLTEDQLLQTEWFGRFDRQLGDTDPDAIETLLQGARALAAEYGAANVVVITDALLPGSMWLLGRYPLDRICQFHDALAEVLLPLHPLHVYLAGDPATLFDRAVAERGLVFRERTVAAVKRWDVPHYPNGPRQSDADVLQFYRWLDCQVGKLTVGSPVRTVFLDATLPITVLLRLLWEHLESYDQIK
jgi:adenylylsulfate kinase-like enzyme